MFPFFESEGRGSTPSGRAALTGWRDCRFCPGRSDRATAFPTGEVAPDHPRWRHYHQRRKVTAVAGVRSGQARRPLLSPQPCDAPAAQCNRDHSVFCLFFEVSAVAPLGSSKLENTVVARKCFLMKRKPPSPRMVSLPSTLPSGDSPLNSSRISRRLTCDGFSDGRPDTLISSPDVRSTRASPMKSLSDF